MPIKRVIVAIPKVMNSTNNFLFEGITSLCLLHISKVNSTQLPPNVIFQFAKKKPRSGSRKGCKGTKI